MFAQIARLRKEEARHDDMRPLAAGVTARSKEREQRRRDRARGCFQSPLMFSRRWAVTEIQRMWRGFAARSTLPFGAGAADLLIFGCQFPHQCEHRGRQCEKWCPNAREWVSRWAAADDLDEAAMEIQRVWRGYVVRFLSWYDLAALERRFKALQAPKKADRMPPATPCQKCQGSGYYTFKAAHTQKHMFLLCAECNGTVVADPWHA